MSERCPRCAAALFPFDHEGVRLSICRRCGGYHVRGADLRRHLGDAASSLLELPVRKGDGGACPTGCGPMEIREVEADGRRVAVDTCRACSGLWLDRGELAAAQAALRASRRTEAKKRLLRDELVSAEPSDTAGAHHAPGWWVLTFVTGLPLEGFNPVHRAPVQTWGLVAACGAVFALELALGQRLLEGLALVPARLFEPSHRLLSHLFVHSGWLHLLGNMYFLKVFGDNVEDRLGRRFYLPFYLACGLAGSLAYALLHLDSDVNLVGASGAIAGVLGAYVVFFPNTRISFILFLQAWHPRAIWYLPAWFGWQILASMIGGPGVAYAAHAAGFAAGVMLALAARNVVPDPRPDAIAGTLR